MLLNAAIARKELYALVALFAVVFNFTTFSYWVNPFSLNVPASWFFPVYTEMGRHEDAWAEVVSRLKDEAKNDPDHDRALVLLPNSTQDIGIFYLGDRYLVTPNLHDAPPACEQALHQVMDSAALERLFAQPEWVVDALHVVDAIPSGYELAMTLPSYRKNSSDGSRPELTRHTFLQPTAVASVRVFRLQRVGTTSSKRDSYGRVRQSSSPGWISTSGIAPSNHSSARKWVR